MPSDKWAQYEEKPAVSDKWSQYEETPAQQAPSGIIPTLKDIGVGAAKGLESSFTALPQMAGNLINSIGGWSAPQHAIDEDKYLKPENTAQKIGKYGEQAAEWALPAAGAGAKLMDLLPSTERAGKLFNEVGEAAKGLPVSLTRSQAPLERIAQLTEAGGPTMGAPNKLLLRSQTVNPIPYEEARDFYSNISNLSAQDKLAANRPMLREIGNLREAFKQDIGDVAASVGKGDQYNQALKEYRQANQLKSGAKTAAKIAGGAALGGTALWPILRSLF